MRARSSRKVRLLSVLSTLAALIALVVLLLGDSATPGQAAAPFGGAPILVNTVTTGWQDEPTIAINPTNPRNLVAGSITGETSIGQCAAYASTDRGRSWSHHVMSNAPTFLNGGDPIVAFDANGIAYFLCMEGGGEPGGVQNGSTQYVWRSTNGGLDWTGPALAIGPQTTTEDRGHMVTDKHPGSSSLGNIYVTATRNPCGSGELRFARSTNSGQSFQPDLKVNDSTDIAFGGSIAVGADGAVYVSWSKMTPCDFVNVPSTQMATAIMIDKSTNGGQTFGALSGGTDHAISSGNPVERVRPDMNRGGSPAVLGAHPTNANIVYAVWPEDPAGSDDSDIAFARSLDGGNTWSTPIRVNDDVNPPGEFFSQFWPTMAVDPTNGEIDIIWYSDQNDPNRSDGTPLIDVYFTSSTNDGVSFGPSIRLSPNFSVRAGIFGDYIYIDSLGGVAHAIWTDTNFSPGVDQEVVTTQIGGADLRVSKSDSPDPAVAGENLSYTIDVTNDGPADAFDVTVIDTLPVGVTFKGSTATCTQAPAGTITCALGDLQSGASTTFGVSTLVDEDLVFNNSGPLIITNSVAVSSDQDDPDLSNNLASEDTLVRAEADVAIVSFTAITPPQQAPIGQPVDVTLRKIITNHGPSSPVDVSIHRTATAPAGSSVTPVASSEIAQAVKKAQLRTVDETFTLTCGNPGAQTFTFGNAIQPTHLTDFDPDPSNNTASLQVTIECVVPVTINIKPGSFPNAVNPRNNGVIPVAILTTSKGEYGTPADFDATTIDPFTVWFGPAGEVWAGTGGASAAHNHMHVEDSFELDETTMDGDLDLVLHFRTQETGIVFGDKQACAKGEFTGAGGATYHFFGCDLVWTVPPGGMPYNPNQAVANFFAHQTTGDAPWTVQFFNNSAAPDGTTWQWDFGDGTTSAAANPAHTYNSAGAFSVTLVATGPNNTDALTRSGFVIVNWKDWAFMPLVEKQP